MLLSVVWVSSCAPSHLPVLMMHGYGGAATDFNDMIQFIEEAHPGTVTVSMPLYEGRASDVALDRQVQGVIDWLDETVTSNATFAHGYHLVCHSQGTLICRGVIEGYERHRVQSYVSIAGPQLGQYGVSVGLFSKFENITTKLAYRVLYTEAVQRTYSVAGYWHDPMHEWLYLSQCHFLPTINNVKCGGLDTRRKDLFLKLHSAVFLGSSGDATIIPWQSSVFGFFAPNSSHVITSITDQLVYTRDTFGLRSMHQRRSLFIHTPPGVSHGEWLHNETLFDQFILPYLF